MTSSPAAPQAIQPRLLRVPALAPLLTVEAVRAALSYTEDEVIFDLEDGTLAWAWNIASSDAQRREVRVFAPCVEQRRAWLENPKWRVKTFAAADVEAALFPSRGGKPFVTSTDLRLALCCSADLVIDLIDAGELRLVEGTSYSAGRTGGAVVTWASVVKFLKDRRI